MLRTQVLECVLGRPMKGDVTDDELLLGRNIQLKLLAVRRHVEDIGAYYRRLPDHANHCRPFEQNKALNVMVLLDHAGVNRAGRGRQVNCGLEGVNRRALGVQPAHQVLRRRDSWSRRHLGRGDVGCPPYGTARSYKEDCAEEQPALNLPREWQKASAQLDRSNLAEPPQAVKPRWLGSTRRPPAFMPSRRGLPRRQPAEAREDAGSRQIGRAHV